MTYYCGSYEAYTQETDYKNAVPANTQTHTHTHKHTPTHKHTHTHTHTHTHDGCLQKDMAIAFHPGLADLREGELFRPPLLFIVQCAVTYTTTALPLN